MHLTDSLIGIRRHRRLPPLSHEALLRQGPVTTASSLTYPWGVPGRLTLTDTRLVFHENAMFSPLFGLDDGGREFLLDLLVLASTPPMASVTNEPCFGLHMACGEVVRFHTPQTVAWIRAIEQAAGRRLWLPPLTRTATRPRPDQFR